MEPRPEFGGLRKDEPDIRMSLQTSHQAAAEPYTRRLWSPAPTYSVFARSPNLSALAP